jgi:hypothetical protein
MSELVSLKTRGFSTYSRFSYNAVYVPKNHRVMEFRAIKITGLMGKIGLVAEHSKPVQSRK